MPSPLKLEHTCLSLPRGGCSAEEYEDAVAAGLEQGRFAIADGASESSFARLWASLLVEEFVRADHDPLQGLTWLDRARSRWPELVGSEPLPWYAEAKRQEGAFAAFLGVCISDDHWQSLAVGDACLFHTRGEALVQATPLEKTSSFTHTPWLLGSPHESPHLLEKKLQRTQGPIQPGDTLWLMTDALAQWFLGEVENGRSPVPLLESFLIDVGACAFAEWIDLRRQSGTLRNDDVTLVAVRMQN